MVKMNLIWIILSSIYYIYRLTCTFHALMYEAVEQRPTVITEGGTGICMYFKLVFALEILDRGTEKNIVLI